MARLRAVLLGATLLLALATGGAAAPVPPRGPDCKAVLAYAPRSQIWIGTLRGARLDSFDYFESRYHEFCFASQAACETWLYAARSYYSYEFAMDGCRPLGQSRLSR